MGGMEAPAAFEGGRVWLNESPQFAERLRDMDKPVGLSSLAPSTWLGINRERVQSPGIQPRARGEGRCYTEVKKLPEQPAGPAASALPRTEIPTVSRKDAAAVVQVTSFRPPPNGH